MSRSGLGEQIRNLIKRHQKKFKYECYATDCVFSFDPLLIDNCNYLFPCFITRQGVVCLTQSQPQRSTFICSRCIMYLILLYMVWPLALLETRVLLLFNAIYHWFALPLGHKQRNQRINEPRFACLFSVIYFVI